MRLTAAFMSIAAMLSTAYEEGRKLNEESMFDLTCLLDDLNLWIKRGGFPPDAWKARS